MNDTLFDKLNDITFESLVLLLFVAAAIIDIIANEELKKSYTDGNGKENIRKKYIMASILVIIVFSYFTFKNYNKLKEFIPGSEEYHCAYIRLIGSLFAVIGESLILYYFINTPEYKK